MTVAIGQLDEFYKTLVSSIIIPFLFVFLFIFSFFLSLYDQNGNKARLELDSISSEAILSKTTNKEEQ